MGERARFVRGLQLRRAGAIVLRIHHDVLSPVGGLGFARASSGGGAESLNFRAARWAGDEPYRKLHSGDISWVCERLSDSHRASLRVAGQSSVRVPLLRYSPTRDRLAPTSGG